MEHNEIDRKGWGMPDDLFNYQGILNKGDEVKKLYKVSTKYPEELFIAEATIIKETKHTYLIEYKNTAELIGAFDFINRWNKKREDTYFTKEDAIKAFEDRCNERIANAERTLENQKNYLKKLEKLKDNK